MSAWTKIFSDTSRVNSTVTVKKANGETRTAKLVVGAGGLDDEAFAEAGKHGATLSASRKDTNADGEVVQKKNTVKSDDLTPKEAAAAVRELLGLADPVPDKVKDRARGAAPSANGTPAAGATGK